MAVSQENGHAEAVVKPNGRKESMQTQRKKKFLGWTIIGLVVRYVLQFEAWQYLTRSDADLLLALGSGYGMRF